MVNIDAPIDFGDCLMWYYKKNIATLRKDTNELIIELRAYDEDGNRDMERIHYDATGWTPEQLTATVSKEIIKLHTI